MGVAGRAAWPRRLQGRLDARLRRSCRGSAAGRPSQSAHPAGLADGIAVAAPGASSAIRRASRGARRSDAGDARRDAAPSAPGGVAAARSDRPADAQADFLFGWVHVDGGPGSTRTPRSHRRRKRRARSDSARCRGRGRASGAGARARLRARPAGDRGSRSRVRAQHRPLRRRPHRVAHAARAGATAARCAG